jgi:hypothetical protein
MPVGEARLCHPARSYREEAAIATTEYILTDADIGRTYAFAPSPIF